MTDIKAHQEFKRKNTPITVDELVEFYQQGYADVDFDTRFTGRVISHEVMREVFRKVFS